MTHLTIDAHVLPGHSWLQALDEALTIAKKCRCAVTLHDDADERHTITILPSSTPADVVRARVLALKHEQERA